ncbi:hypothetical protein BG004_005745 [Podila humilis]|nr:hypothetical protein BG004_005745 [Podila humilis]
MIRNHDGYPSIPTKARNHGPPTPTGSTSWFSSKSKSRSKRTPAPQRSINGNSDYFGPAALLSHNIEVDETQIPSVDSSQTCGKHSTSSRRRRRPKIHRTQHQSLSPDPPVIDCLFPLPTPDSLRSVEPYMNPPPRSIAGSDKASFWTHYLCSTMEHFLKVKRAFTSKSSSRRNSRFLDSGSSIVLTGAGMAEVYKRKESSASTVSPPTKSSKSSSATNRHWPLLRAQNAPPSSFKSALVTNDAAEPLVYASPVDSGAPSLEHLPETPRAAIETNRAAWPSQDIPPEKLKNMRFGRRKSGRGSDASAVSTSVSTTTRRLTLPLLYPVPVQKSKHTDDKDSRSSWLTFSTKSTSMFASIFARDHDGHSDNLRNRMAQGRSGSLDSAFVKTSSRNGHSMAQPPFLQKQKSMTRLGNKGSQQRFQKPSPLSLGSSNPCKSIEDPPGVLPVSVLAPRRSLRALRKKTQGPTTGAALQGGLIHPEEISDNESAGDENRCPRGIVSEWGGTQWLPRDIVFQPAPPSLADTRPSPECSSEDLTATTSQYEVDIQLGSKSGDCLQVNSSDILVPQDTSQPDHLTVSQRQTSVHTPLCLPTLPTSTTTAAEHSANAASMTMATTTTKRVISHAHSYSQPIVVTPSDSDVSLQAPTVAHTTLETSCGIQTHNGLKPKRPATQLRSNSDPHLSTMASLPGTSASNSSTVSSAMPLMMNTTSAIERSIKSLAVNMAKRGGGHGPGSTLIPQPILTSKAFFRNCGDSSRQNSRQHSPLYPAATCDMYKVEGGKVVLRTNELSPSLLSPVALASEPPPFISAVLIYRSEMIAQQLCLIERELLLKVQWYELVDAGWTKKKQKLPQHQQAPSLKEWDNEQEQDPLRVQDGEARKSEQDKGPDSIENSRTDPCKDDGVSDGDVDSARDSSGTGAGSGSGSGLRCGAEDQQTNRKDEQEESEEEVQTRRRQHCTARLSNSRRGSRSHTPIPKEVDEASPNIKQLVDRFNMTCEWVTAEILRSTNEDLRVKVVEKFIRVAHTCYNHSNFSSLTQIMLGLQHHTVSRLARTWDRIQAEEAKVMQELTDFTAPFHNFKHIRNAMKAVADEWGGHAGGAIMGDSQPMVMSASTPSATCASEQPHQQYTSLGSTMAAAGPTPPLETATMGAVASTSASASAGRRATGGPGSGMGIFFRKHNDDEPGSWSNSQQQPQSGSTAPVVPSSSSNGNLDQHQGGSIPFLGIYLSDLVYNNELPSHVEPRAPPRDEATAQALFEAMVSTSNTTAMHLPTPQSSLGSLGGLVDEQRINNTTHHPIATATTPATTSVPFESCHPFDDVAPSWADHFNHDSSNSPDKNNRIMLVNMHKHRTTATIIKRILTFQTLAGRYPFQREPNVFDWLQNLERSNEDPKDFYRMSVICEERVR